MFFSLISSGLYVVQKKVLVFRLLSPLLKLPLNWELCLTWSGSTCVLQVPYLMGQMVLPQIKMLECIKPFLWYNTSLFAGAPTFEVCPQSHPFPTKIGCCKRMVKLDQPDRDPACNGSDWNGDPPTCCPSQLHISVPACSRKNKYCKQGLAPGTI